MSQGDSNYTAGIQTTDFQPPDAVTRPPPAQSSRAGQESATDVESQGVDTNQTRSESEFTPSMTRHGELDLESGLIPHATAHLRNPSIASTVNTDAHTVSTNEANHELRTTTPSREWSRTKSNAVVIMAVAGLAGFTIGLVARPHGTDDTGQDGGGGRSSQ
ncbi:hypothetical protein IAT40_001662 [Kwoniella sp. CBS 6097]